MLDERLLKQAAEVKKAYDRRNEALEVYTAAREAHERSLGRCDAKQKKYRTARRNAAKLRNEIEAEKSNRRKQAYETFSRLEKRESRIRDLSGEVALLVPQRDKVKSLLNNAVHAVEEQIIYYTTRLKALQARLDELAWEIDYMREANAQDKACLFIKLFCTKKLDDLRARYKQAMDLRIKAWAEYQSACSDEQTLAVELADADAMYERRRQALINVRASFFKRRKRLREEAIPKAERERRMAEALKAAGLEDEDVEITLCRNGKVQIYYGGKDAPDGPGHGHASVYADGGIQRHRLPKTSK